MEWPARLPVLVRWSNDTLIIRNQTNRPMRQFVSNIDQQKKVFGYPLVYTTLPVWNDSERLREKRKDIRKETEGSGAANLHTVVVGYAPH